MEALLQDLRFALRLLRKNPGFTLVAVLCLAVGIGANTTIFSIVNAVLLRPFPCPDPDRVVSLFESQPRGETQRTGLSYLNYLDLARQNGVFSEIAAFKEKSLTFTGLDEPERVAAQAISASLFPLLGVQPQKGRNFRPEDDRQGAPGVVLISHGLWSRRFGADPGALGRSVLVDGREHTIVGIMPPGFNFPEHEEAWIPLEPQVASDLRTYRDLQVLARLRPGVTLERARRETDTIAGRLATDHPESNTGWSFGVLPLREDFTSDRLRLIVLAAMGAVVVVLLIACVNLANLLLARSTSRQREIAVRLAFGARRGSILRQLLTESLVLALSGGLLGVLLAYGAIHLILAAIPVAGALPYWIDVRIDAAVVLFTVAVSCATGILFGLAPALQATRTDLNRTLREGGRGMGGSQGRIRLRGALVVAEIALSLVLLVGAALFVRSFLKLMDVKAGFDTAGLLTLRLSLSGETYKRDEPKVRLVSDVVERLEALPGVQAVGASNTVPLAGGGNRRSILLEGRSFAPGQEPTVFYTGVTAHFFRALGVPVTAGRGLEDRETPEEARAALVNRTFAERFWPGGAVLGRRFQLKNEPERGWITIVGIVPDFSNDHIDKRIPPSVYVPFFVKPSGYTGLLIRTRLDPARLAGLVRRQIHAADPNVPIFQVATMEAIRRETFWEYRLFSGLFTIFSGIALFLAALGVYGVLAYAVHQRRREIGVRVALGARQGQILGFFLKQGLGLTLCGIVLGLLGAVAASRVIASLLYGVSATDLDTFAGISLLLAGVALFASYLPARRATAVDPLESLRAE
jgi:predicted permease